MLEYDDDSFIDCTDANDHMEEIDSDAEVGDGDWMFDMGSRLQHRTNHSTAGLRRSVGTMQVFSSKEEANRQAELVWFSLQANHPFTEVPPEGKKCSDSEEEDEGTDEEEEEEEDGDRTTKGKRRSSSRSSRRKGSGNAASSQKGGKSKSSSAKGKQARAAAAAVDPSRFKTVTADGRAHWQREQRFYVDPWAPAGADDELKNICRSVLTVEVVEAQLVG